MIEVERPDFVSVPVTDLERTTAFALRVPDVAEARRELEARRVALHGQAFDTGVGHMAHFSDPGGNVLVLHRGSAPRA